MNFFYIIFFSIIYNSCSSSQSFRKLSSNDDLKIAQSLFEQTLIRNQLYKKLNKDMYVYHWRTKEGSGIKENSKHRKKNKQLVQEYIKWTTDHFWGEEIVDFEGYAAMGPGLYTTFDPFSSSKFALGTRAAHNYSLNTYTKEELMGGLLIEILLPQGTPFLDIHRDIRESNTITGFFDEETKQAFGNVQCHINNWSLWGELLHNNPHCRKITMPIMSKLKIQFMPHKWSNNLINSFDFENNCIDMNIAILLLSSENISTNAVQSYVYEDFQDKKLDPKIRFFLKAAPNVKTFKIDALVIQAWGEHVSKEENDKIITSKLSDYRKWVLSHPHCGNILGRDEAQSPSN